jgi:hypothetical protein
MKCLINLHKSMSHNFSKKIEDAIEFYFHNHFVNYGLYPDTNINIYFLDNIPTNISTKKSYCVGKTIFEKDNYTIFVKRNISTKQLIKTLFHELTHVKQHCEERYYFIDRNVLWEYNKLYLFNDQNTIDYNVYCSFPWEIEARQIEDHLYKLLKSNTFWYKLWNYFK